MARYMKSLLVLKPYNTFTETDCSVSLIMTVPVVVMVTLTALLEKMSGIAKENDHILTGKKACNCWET